MSAASGAPGEVGEAGGPLPPIRRLRAGHTGATPLLLLHGFTADHRLWRGFAAALGPALERHAADVRAPWPPPIWAADLLGHGAAPAPREAGAWRLEAQADGLAAALAARGVERAHWVGYSMGGRLALTAAARRPEALASLTLIGATAGLEAPEERRARREADEALAAFLEREGLAAFVARWEAHPLFASQARLGPRHRARMRALRMAQRPSALAASLRGAGTGAMTPLWDVLESVRLPTLLLTGARDEKFRALAEAMARRLPRARHAVLDGAGHAAMLEAPAACAETLAAFLFAVASGTEERLELSPPAAAEDP